MSDKSAQQYSFEEVKKHNDKKSIWIVIHNNVYDVTSFLSEHPAGEEVLLEQAGREASEAFEDIGHSSVARELTIKYKIGEIIESERVATILKNDDSEVSSNADSLFAKSFQPYLIPLALGILATFLYRAYVKS